MPLQAAGVAVCADVHVSEAWQRCLAAWAAALHHAIQRVADSREKSSIPGNWIERWLLRRIEGGIVEVIGALIALAIRSVQADAHPQVQSQLLGDPPVVLEIRLDGLVAVVILNLGVPLLVAG